MLSVANISVLKIGLVCQSDINLDATALHNLIGLRNGQCPALLSHIQARPAENCLGLRQSWVAWTYNRVVMYRLTGYYACSCCTGLSWSSLYLANGMVSSCCSAFFYYLVYPEYWCQACLFGASLVRRAESLLGTPLFWIPSGGKRHKIEEGVTDPLMWQEQEAPRIPLVRLGCLLVLANWEDILRLVAYSSLWQVLVLYIMPIRESSIVHVELISRSIVPVSGWPICIQFGFPTLWPTMIFFPSCLLNQPIFLHVISTFILDVCTILHERIKVDLAFICAENSYFKCLFSRQEPSKCCYSILKFSSL